MNATIKDNILFYSPYDEEKYKKAIQLSELLDDFKILVGGDMTEVGERGINLSGGQKQRICIARALYNEADIYIIDDCLSALDAHVGKSIFYNVIKKELMGKTRILVTHALQYIHEVDRIVVFKKGRIVENGTYEEIARKEESELKDFMRRVEQAQKKQEEEEKKRRRSSIDYPKEKVPKPTETNAIALVTKVEKTEEEKKNKGALVGVEELFSGSIPLRIYGAYIKAAGWCALLTAIPSLCSAQVSQTLSNW